jgi:hypothetical protein
MTDWSILKETISKAWISYFRFHAGGVIRPLADLPLQQKHTQKEEHRRTFFFTK